MSFNCLDADSIKLLSKLAITGHGETRVSARSQAVSMLVSRLVGKQMQRIQPGLGAVQ